MKIVIFAIAATIGLSGCVSDGVRGGGYAYDGYYDNGYGSIYDGYWGDGDVFYYRNSQRGHYLRDDQHHFRRDSAAGYQSMHVTGPRYRGGHRKH